MATQQHSPLIIGLTGGIGSGKSTVSDMFAALGAEVIDADVISRSLLQPGNAAFDAVAEHFGPDILQADGSLDRARLRHIVFSDAGEKTWLEACLHPRIRATILQQIAISERPWVLLSVPLLLESDAYDFVDKVLVVDVAEELQLQRTLARDDSSEAEVRAIIASQMPRQQRLARADLVIGNEGDLQTLQERVAELYNHFEELAREQHQTG